MRILQDFIDEKTPWATFIRKVKCKVIGAKPETWVIQKYVQGLTLNVGCGDDKIPGTVGVDNFKLEEYTKRKVALGTVRADVLHLPFKDGTVDTVIAKHIWEHVDRDRFLWEMWRVLKPGGILAIVLPNGDYLSEKVYWRDPTHIWLALPKEVMGLFVKSRRWELVQYNKLKRWHYPWSFDIVVQKV